MNKFAGALTYMLFIDVLDHMLGETAEQVGNISKGLHSKVLADKRLALEEKVFYIGTFLSKFFHLDW